MELLREARADRGYAFASIDMTNEEEVTLGPPDQSGRTTSRSTGFGGG